MESKLKAERKAQPIWEKKWCTVCAERICNEIDSKKDYYLSKYQKEFINDIIKNIEHRWDEIKTKESNEYKDWYLRAWDVVLNSKWE